MRGSFTSLIALVAVALMTLGTTSFAAGSDLFAVVRKKIRNGDMSGAFDECAKLKSRAPDAEWSDMMARCYIFLGNKKHALEFAERANKLKPGRADFIATLAFAQLQAGRRPQAAETANRAIALDRKNGRAYAVAAIAERKSGSFQTPGAMKMAYKLAPSDFEVNFLGLQMPAANFLEDDGSEDPYDRFVRMAPDSAYAYFLRGIHKRKTFDPKSAIDDLTKAIALNPKYIMAHGYRAKLYKAEHQWQKAIDDFNFVVKDFGGASFYARRGECYLQLGNIRQAQSDYKQALQLMEKRATDKNGKFDYARLDGEAKSDYESWWISQTEILSKLGNSKEALSETARMLKVFPDNLQALHLRQEILMKEKRYADALENLNKLVVACPKVSEYYRKRATALQMLGRKADAKLDFKRAESLDKFGSIE